MRLTVLMPLRDDWSSAGELIGRLDGAISSLDWKLHIILVDDGSKQQCDRQTFQKDYQSIQTIGTLRLRRNLGHQRAIAIGLAYVHQSVPCDAIMVMDADGEDTPEGAAQLLRTYCSIHGTKAVFAERSRRSESLVFRAFYSLYKLLHRCFTGISVRVGNFSILPARYLNTLVVMSELWNHYAAAVFRSDLPFTMVPIPRGHRIEGPSKMNFVALVSHGLSAISVFGDIVGVRLLIGSLIVAVLGGLAKSAILLLNFFYNNDLLDWVNHETNTFAVILFQLITIATSFTFFVLFSRANLGFIPFRDYAMFIEEYVELCAHD